MARPFFASLVVNVEFEPVSAVLNKIELREGDYTSNAHDQSIKYKSSEHMASLAWAVKYAPDLKNINGP